MKRKVTDTLYLTLMMTMLMTIPVFAGGLEGSNLVTGTKKLISDGTAVLTGLVAGLTVLLSIKNAIAWQAASDEEKPKHKKTFVTTLGLGVIGTTIAGVITVILSYYGG